MRRLTLGVSILLGLAGAARAASEIQVAGGRFVDGAGRLVVLRGLNVAGNAKVPPFRPATPEVFDPLPAWGVEVVRLLFTWEAYEPDPGRYDASYLAYYTDAVRAAWQRKIYVIVDFHQDGFSRFAVGGCGDGFPKWALPPSVTPAPPDNGAACAAWGSKMLGDPDLPRIWDAFYSDQFGARTRYLAMVGSVAAALAAEPAVIGYDLLNEPGGDEVAQIGPLYRDAAQAIRAADPRAVLFVSPRALTSAGTATMLERPGFANFAYAPHYYDPGVFLIHTWNGYDEKAPFDRMAGQAAAWGAPLFLGEFGAPPATEEVAGYLATVGDRLDEGFASAAEWCYTPGWTDAAKDGWNAEDFSVVDGNRKLRANFALRPIPRRIAGAPGAFTFTRGDAPEVALRWTHDPAKGATEIFLPARAVLGTDEAAIATTGGVDCAATGDLLSCTSATAGEKTVRATPARRSCGLTGGELLLVIAIAVGARRRRAES
jgi:endoglycosylceramidase